MESLKERLPFGVHVARDVKNVKCIDALSLQVPFKLAQFSCHDTSLIPLLFNLKLMDMDKTPHWPGCVASAKLVAVDLIVPGYV